MLINTFHRKDRTAHPYILLPKLNAARVEEDKQKWRPN